MVAGVTERLWGIGDIVAILEAWETRKIDMEPLYQFGGNPAAQVTVRLAGQPAERLASARPGFHDLGRAIDAGDGRARCATEEGPGENLDADPCKHRRQIR
jgi:hypothetical protein